MVKFFGIRVGGNAVCSVIFLKEVDIIQIRGTIEIINNKRIIENETNFILNVGFNNFGILDSPTHLYLVLDSKKLE
jgi:hypothetical protein